MSDEVTEGLDDLKKQKLKRAAGSFGGVTRQIDAVIASSPMTDDTKITLDQEIHRRGVPEWFAFDMLAWPMGTLNFSTSHLLDAGLDATKARRALSIMCTEMIEYSFSGDGADPLGSCFEDFLDELDLHCDCNDYHCPRNAMRIAQARHAMMTAISAVFNLFEAPLITPLDRERSTPEQISAWEMTAKTLDDQFRLSTMVKVEAILEFLLGLIVESGLAK